MKKWFRPMDLAAPLGLITVHLILWQMLLVCAGSPLKGLHAPTAPDDSENNKLQIMELTNNVSYEISTNTQSKVSHVFNNYLDIKSSRSSKSDDAMPAPQISSIYEIFLINNNQSNVRELNSLMRIDRSAQTHPKHSGKSKRVKSGGGGGGKSTLDRNERSANLSHITGNARKIQLYIKNRFLQLMPDGTVNGTTDDASDYTILQRTTVNVGQIKIQGVATCLFLCMDSCGFSYGSIEFTDDCIFNESMEQHHYNTYSSTRHSNAKRTFYLGLNRHGQPRKIQLPASRQLGKLSTYTKSLTQTVAHERVDQLVARLYGANHLRHGLKQLCDTGRVVHTLKLKAEARAHKCGGGGKAATGNGPGGGKKKRKKKRCRGEDGEMPGQSCLSKQAAAAAGSGSGNVSSINDHKSVQGKKKAPATSGGNQKKPTNSNNNNGNGGDKKKKQQQLTKKSGPSGKHHHQQQQRGKKKVAKSIPTTTPKPDEEYIEHDVVDLSLEEDEDYDEMNVDAERDTTNFNAENQYD